jgi:hypothetical protein
MRSFQDPEELVAAYWHKLASSIERAGARSKTQAVNGRLQSRSSHDSGRVRQRSAALRNVMNSTNDLREGVQVEVKST